MFSNLFELLNSARTYVGTEDKMHWQLDKNGALVSNSFVRL